MSISSDQQVAPRAGGADEASAARQRRLAAGVAALRLRKGSGLSFDRVLLIVGSVLVPLGALLIVLGWYGASHTPNLFEQVPYLISGGLLGVALVGAGGFFYFGYWLTKQVYEARSHNADLVAALNRIEAQLNQERGPSPVAVELRNATANGSGGGAAAGAAANGRARRGSAVASTAPMLVATATGTMLHRADCSVVAHRDGLLEVPADAAGYKPCRLCDPVVAN
jgi:hypothetical protein